MASIVDLKNRLSEFIDRAASGERIVIYRHNRPVAELGPATGARTEPRPIGPLAGRPTFDVPRSFLEPMTDDELRAWEEGPLAGSGSFPTRAKRRPSRAAEPKPAYGRSLKRRR
jgi:prevent-host-death family protein